MYLAGVPVFEAFAAAMLWRVRQRHLFLFYLLLYQAIDTGLFLCFMDAKTGVSHAWSPPSYHLSVTFTCALILGAAIEAALRSTSLPIERLHAIFGVVLIALTAYMGGMILECHFPSESVQRPMMRLHFAAAAACGLIVQRLNLDQLNYDALRWLFIGRFAQALRIALLEIGPWVSVYAGGVANLAWCAVSFWALRHCFTVGRAADGRVP